MNRVAVVGASGFTGALAALLIHRHPSLELAAITARSEVGRRLDSLYPRYRVPLELEPFDADQVAGTSDAAVVGYPHGAAAEVVAQLRERDVKVVDLSADFRLDRSRYELYYRPHPRPEMLAEAVYGLPELHRDEIAAAELVAAPGCYPTAAVLALAPLAGHAADVIIDAKSGVSGAGRTPSDATHFVAVTENVTAYGVEGHRHRAELEQELSDFGPITFTPHLVPLDQGLLASCYVTPASALDSERLADLFYTAYSGETFVELVDSPPGVREVRETNFCRIYATLEPATGRVVVLAALDNLYKGAASQALQALNLMLGLPETAGLL